MTFENSTRRTCSTLPAIALLGVLCVTDRGDASQPLPLEETRTIQQMQSYCATSWRNANIPRAEWPDCSQQVFSELLERVPRHQLASAITHPASSARRELNRSIWRIAKRWSRAVRPKSLNGYDAADHRAAPQRASDRDGGELAKVLKDAQSELTSRQSRILNLLSRGLSVSEIAEQLQIPAARVSDEKYRAIQKVRRRVAVS